MTFNFINQFFKQLEFKKQHIEILKNKIILLDLIRNKKYQSLNFSLFFQNEFLFWRRVLIRYTISISFTNKNTWVHIMSSLGKLKCYYSKGSFMRIKGKKTTKKSALKLIIQFLSKKKQTLFNRFVALHLQNVKFLKFWILRKLKKKFQIQTVKSFYSRPFNGCRKKKIKRKKIKRKKRRNCWVA